MERKFEEMNLLDVVNTYCLEECDALVEDFGDCTHDCPFGPFVTGKSLDLIRAIKNRCKMCFGRNVEEEDGRCTLISCPLWSLGHHLDLPKQPVEELEDGRILIRND